MPRIITEIGSVARLLSGAITAPRIPAVATMTVWLAPASACATASTSALRRARASSAATSNRSATADIPILQKSSRLKQFCFLAGRGRFYYCGIRRSEVHGPGVAGHHGGRFRRRLGTDLAQSRPDFRDEELDNVVGSLRAERAEAPQERLAGHRRLGPERERAHHVGTAADARVHQQRRTLSYRGSDCRQAIDRRRQGVDLTAAVVRHHDAVDAERHGLLRIGRMQDALDHERSLPAVAIALDLLPGEGATHLGARERGDLIDAGVL